VELLADGYGIGDLDVFQLNGTPMIGLSAWPGFRRYRLSPHEALPAGRLKLGHVMLSGMN
jgi:hypothetical protein